MSLQIGQQLGSCEITSLIGKVGMGEVYRSTLQAHEEYGHQNWGGSKSQEESSRDSEAGMIGGERDGKPRHSRIFYDGSISSGEGLCFVFESFF
jgi:hypothetical protein